MHSCIVHFFCAVAFIVISASPIAINPFFIFIIFEFVGKDTNFVEFDKIFSTKLKNVNTFLTIELYLTP